MPKPPEARQFLSQTRAIVKLLHQMRAAIVHGHVELTGVTDAPGMIDQAIVNVHEIADAVKITQVPTHAEHLR